MIVQAANNSLIKITWHNAINRIAGCLETCSQTWLQPTVPSAKNTSVFEWVVRAITLSFESTAFALIALET